MTRSNARYNPLFNDPLDYFTTEAYKNFCADDYTWTVADNTYFYFAWCDRSLPSWFQFSQTWYQRPDVNISFAKIRQ